MVLFPTRKFPELSALCVQLNAYGVYSSLLTQSPGLGVSFLLSFLLYVFACLFFAALPASEDVFLTWH